LRADRIDMDISWSDQDDHGWSEPAPRRRDHRSAHRHEHARHDERARTDERVRHPRTEHPATEDPPVRAIRAPAAVPAPEPRPVVAREAIEGLAPRGATGALSPTSLITGVPTDVLAAPQPEPAPARRTVVIRGQGTQGYARSRGGYEARLRPHERSGFKPDRVALWAVLLGLALLLGAVTSSHAATLPAIAWHHVLAGHQATVHPLLPHRPTP
jgi:hypothetical protein